jgi:hypothetical protein
MRIIFTRLLAILGIASLAACALAYSVATEAPHRFYVVVFWLATFLLLLASVWAFAPMSRRSVANRVVGLFAAALSFLVVWVFSSQLTIHVILLLRNAHAP